LVRDDVVVGGLFGRARIADLQGVDDALVFGEGGIHPIPDDAHLLQVEHPVQFVQHPIGDLRQPIVPRYPRNRHMESLVGLTERREVFPTGNVRARLV
jgi:hypothetical protein